MARHNKFLPRRAAGQKPSVGYVPACQLSRGIASSNLTTNATWLEAAVPPVNRYPAV